MYPSSSNGIPLLSINAQHENAGDIGYDRVRRCSLTSQPSLPSRHNSTGNETQNKYQTVARVDPIRVDSGEVSPRSSSGIISGYRRWIYGRLWPLEVLAWIGSLMLLLAIVIVLAKFEHSRSPNLRFGITLNTIVSILATVLSFLLMIPITAAIGQLKWIWFRRPRRLADFQIIDDASRGPKGSVISLLTLRGGILTIIGSFLTIAVLGINPAVQAMVSFPLLPIVKDRASTLPVASRLVGVENTTSTTGVYFPDPPLLSAIDGAAIHTTTPVSYDVSPSCSTGNCTWSAYNTLAVCHSCANLTHLLTWTDGKGRKLSQPPPKSGNWTYALPNGFELFFSAAATRSLTVSSEEESIAFGKNYSKFADFQVIGMTLDPNGYTNVTSPFAFECMLQFCVKQFNATTVDSNTTESELQSWTNNTSAAGVELLVVDDGTVDRTYSWSPPWSAQNGSWTATMKGNAWQGLQANLTDSFSGYGLYQFIYQTYDQVNKSRGGTGPLILTNSSSLPIRLTNFAASNQMTQAIWTALSSPPFSLDPMMDNIARSMTNNFRTRDAAGPPAIGTATLLTPFVHVNWGWITVPAFCMTLALLFFLTIALLSARHGLRAWADNALPIIFCDTEFDPRISQAMSSLQGLDAMEQAAKDIKMQLMYHDGQWHLKQT